MRQRAIIALPKSRANFSNVLVESEMKAKYSIKGLKKGKSYRRQSSFKKNAWIMIVLQDTRSLSSRVANQILQQYTDMILLPMCISQLLSLFDDPISWKHI